MVLRDVLNSAETGSNGVTRHGLRPMGIEGVERENNGSKGAIIGGIVGRIINGLYSLT